MNDRLLPVGRCAEVTLALVALVFHTPLEVPPVLDVGKLRVATESRFS